ncbi:hypothetical protein ACZ90_60005 [Streptomyces albus subsp. albus]|nr:hypothetical protein ACZ90_60005 [Streptomyces albus subsp. albus]
MTTSHATGTFTYVDWEEKRVSEVAGATALAHASVSNTYSGAIDAAGTSCQYTIAYLTEKTGRFSGYEQLTGTLDGRTGSFVLVQHGTFDEEGAVCEYQVLPGSGSGELAGLTGEGGFTAPTGQQEYTYRLDYRLE